MDYDVIVAGGGPAGAVAARECARAGLDTLILEKEHLPRMKLCAGGITLAALKLLEVPVPPEIVEARCTSFRTSHGSKSIELNMGKEFIIVVSRDSFDHWLVKLAQKAGAVLKQGEKVTSVDVGRQKVTVSTLSSVYSGRILIGADGVNSTVSKMVRSPFNRTDLAFSFCADVPAAQNEDRETVEICYGPKPLSYGWIFPKRGCNSIGTGVWLSSTNNVKAVLEHFLRERGLQDIGFKGHSIPLGGPCRTTVSERIILVGDAAGFTDPFTGEGIRYAVASGRLAAATVVDLISAGLPLNKKTLKIYERKCYREFGADLKSAMLLAISFKHFPKTFFGVYFGCREPFQKSLELLQGRLGYRQLCSWLLWNAPGLLQQWASCGMVRLRGLNSH